ncbi:D site-binding protein [Nocardia ninae]|uniref:Uncharacterized protein n=1 Tax=Nocardia ninae NBRC 108245 TaxID=1210091 RepID=A0A511ML38_9NOCA|nr:D site-binding protein [Nocardia ninae]GEM40847.1 hypothetical protein NN4_53660 [Nocardia ninae NBRC 108245]
MDGGHLAGGSLELAGLIDRYGEELLADFQHHYGLDLRDIFVAGSGLSPRRCMALIAHLPHDAAFVAAWRGGPQYRGWDEDRYLAVAQVNAIRELSYLYISAHAKRRPAPPEPIPTPEAETRRTSKPNQFAELMRRARTAASSG